MLLVILHVEYAFRLSKAPSYVMLALVGVAAVYLRKHCGITD